MTFCVMNNHFHLLVEVPRRPASLPTDEELVRLIKVAGCSYCSVQRARDLKGSEGAGRVGLSEGGGGFEGTVFSPDVGCERLSSDLEAKVYPMVQRSP